MPLLAKQMDKATLIRSVSYTPAGLFNHTAAIYQMMTGYTPDRVSPSGQLEPPAPERFPARGFADLAPQAVRHADAAVRHAAAAVAGEQRHRQRRHGWISRPGVTIPIIFTRTRTRRLSWTTSRLRKDVSKERLERRATLLASS